jgi:carboxymethylenebutenolidase
MGEMIEFDTPHGPCPGYLAAPARPRPAVIVLQEWWGLNDHVKDVCDRLADGGFVALAPDLFRGEVTTRPDEAQRLMMGLEVPRAVADIAGAARHLLSLDGVTGERVAILGFCMGGGLALIAGGELDEIVAAVDFYGVIPWDGVTAPRGGLDKVLGIFGSEDASIPEDRRAALESGLTAGGADVEFYVFDDCDHAFFNDTRPEVYDEDAAADAWQLTLDFLDAARA